jgi:hypothetical protein
VGGAARTRKPGGGTEPCDGTTGEGHAEGARPPSDRSGRRPRRAASQGTERSRMRREGAQLERERGRDPPAHGRAGGKGPRVNRA